MPSRSQPLRRVTYLAALLLVQAACRAGVESADAAPVPGEADQERSAVDRLSAGLREALGSSVDRVLHAEEIRVDGRPVALLGHFERGSDESVACCSADGMRCLELGLAQKSWVAGHVDLDADQLLPTGRRSPGDLRSNHSKRPVLLLATMSSQPVSFKPGLKPLAAKAPGIRKEKVVHVVDYGRRGPRLLLRLEVEVESGDGFGGFRLQRLALRQRDGKALIEAMRQDRLDASRARCLKPKPYMVRFELDGDRFRPLPTDAPASPCR